MVLNQFGCSCAQNEQPKPQLQLLVAHFGAEKPDQTGLENTSSGASGSCRMSFLLAQQGLQAVQEVMGVRILQGKMVGRGEEVPGLLGFVLCKKRQIVTFSPYFTFTPLYFHYDYLIPLFQGHMAIHAAFILTHFFIYDSSFLLLTYDSYRLWLIF